MMRVMLIALLLYLPLAAQEKTGEENDTTTNVTSSEIPADGVQHGWPTNQAGASFRIQSITLDRPTETITIDYREGTGEGPAFVPVGAARTMTITLHDTCPVLANCLTFLYDGPNPDPLDLQRRRYWDRTDTRQVRNVTRKTFQEYTNMILEYFQPQRMKDLP